MKVLDFHKENGEMSVSLYIEKGEFDAALDEAYMQDPQRYFLPGQGDGPPPREKLEKLYGHRVLYEEALEIALPAALEDFVGEQGIMLAAEPEITKLAWPAKGGATVSLKAEVFPEVVIDSYKGMAAKWEGDEDAFAQALLEKAIGRLDIELPHSLVQGRLQTIIAQEKAIVDQDPIYSMLADMVAILEGIYRLLDVVRPRDDIRDEAMDILLKTVSSEQEVSKDRLFGLLGEAAAKYRELPEGFEADLNRLMERRRKQLEGMTHEQRAEDRFTTYLSSLEVSEEQWLQQRRQLAVDQLKQDLLLDEVCRQEGISTTQQEVDAAYAELSKQYGVQPEQIKQTLPEGSVGWQLCREKALRLMIDSAIRI